MIRELNVVEVEQVSGGFNQYSSSDDYNYGSTNRGANSYRYSSFGFGDGEEEKPPEGEKPEKPKKEREPLTPEEAKELCKTLGRLPRVGKGAVETCIQGVENVEKYISRLP